MAENLFVSRSAIAALMFLKKARLTRAVRGV
jgi:hypothetical protein